MENLEEKQTRTLQGLSVVEIGEILRTSGVLVNEIAVFENGGEIDLGEDGGVSISVSSDASPEIRFWSEKGLPSKKCDTLSEMLDEIGRNFPQAFLNKKGPLNFRTYVEKPPAGRRFDSSFPGVGGGGAYYEAETTLDMESELKKWDSVPYEETPHGTLIPKMWAILRGYSPELKDLSVLSETVSPDKGWDSLVDDLSRDDKISPVWIALYGDESGGKRPEYLHLWTYSEEEPVRDLVGRLERWIESPPREVEGESDMATFIARNLLALSPEKFDICLATAKTPVRTSGDITLSVGIGSSSVHLELSVEREGQMRFADRRIVSAVGPEEDEEPEVEGPGH